MQSYTTYLHANMTRLVPSSGDRSLLKENITELLGSILSHLDLFQVKAVENHPWYYPTQPSTVAKTLKGDPMIAMKFIAQCVESDNTPTAVTALKRMTDMVGQPQDVAQARATTVLLPLLKFLSEDPKIKPALPQIPLSEITVVAIPLALQSIEAKGGKFTQDTICTLLDSLLIADTPQLLMTVYAFHSVQLFFAAD